MNHAVDDIGAWRARERERLIEARMAMSAAARRAASAAIVRALFAQLGPANPGVVACYWAIRGEFDCRPVMLKIIALGGQVALPAAIRPRQPLEFRRWTPRTTMAAGLGGAPHPVEEPAVKPELLLVPLVGFDARGFRLGYGGGYYDRTLAANASRLATWGVGSELGRLETIHPQPHDAPLDLIFTEGGTIRLDAGR